MKVQYLHFNITSTLTEIYKNAIGTQGIEFAAKQWRCANLNKQAALEQIRQDEYISRHRNKRGSSTQGKLYIGTAWGITGKSGELCMAGT